MNRYLRDRAMRRDMRRDGRTRVSGYLRRSRDNAYERGMNDYRGMDYRRDYESNSYDRYDDYPMIMRDEYDMRGSRDYRRDYNYDYASEDEDYRHDLKSWQKKLKAKDKYGMSMDQVVSKARNYGAKFDEYDEEELYTCYLMMVSDYSNYENDPMKLIQLAIGFLKDEDSKYKGSDKLCAYMYELAMEE